jgi:CO/xanthine dehydrogenase Mo-binding subunit
VETCGLGSTNVLYDAPAIEFDHVVHTVNVSQPSFMRAPGECPGTYALECAMDELAYALKMDPLELRLVNNSPNHPIKGIRGQRSICVNATIRARGNLAGPDELTSHAQ